MKSQSSPCNEGCMPTSSFTADLGQQNPWNNTVRQQHLKDGHHVGMSRSQDMSKGMVTHYGEKTQGLLRYGPSEQGAGMLGPNHAFQNQNNLPPNFSDLSPGLPPYASSTGTSFV